MRAATQASSWKDVLTIVRELAPASEWRARLAREVRIASGARFVAVFTCPPGNPVEAQATVVPRALVRVVRKVHADYLPRIERAQTGIALATTERAQAYAPLSATSHRRLATALKRDVLAPEGIDGLVNAFFVHEDRAPLGWICIGTTEPSRVALRKHGAALSEVAGEAARTLASAIDLAAGCGARAPVERGAEVALSARERQIAALVGAGLSDANVAARLSLSEETVGAHLRRIYRKLGVHTRIALAARLSPLGERSFVIAE